MVPPRVVGLWTLTTVAVLGLPTERMPLAAVAVVAEPPSTEKAMLPAVGAELFRQSQASSVLRLTHERTEESYCGGQFNLKDCPQFWSKVLVSLARISGGAF